MRTDMMIRERERPAKGKTSLRGSRAGEIARGNRTRYEYVRQRAHLAYCEGAKKCERFFLGRGLGGGQWEEEVEAELEAEGRKAIEINEIFETVCSSVGYQISNRADISFRPRGEGADDEKAALLSKLVMQIADQCRLHWKETEVFTDGLIQQRGYFDIRLSFDNNILGEIAVEVDDPLDCIPDPDAKTYDPDGWADYTKTRWLTLDEIEAMYGEKARKAVEERHHEGERDFGEDEDEAQRNKFGAEEYGVIGGLEDYRKDGDGVMRVRVIDRQHWKVVRSRVLVYPTGDVRIADNLDEERIQFIINTRDAMLIERPQRRVRWTVSTMLDVLIHDDWSPYEHFTVVPFFPYFRRGITRGQVDNLIDPQEMLNKAVSQHTHIVNSAANSGWEVEQNSLTNMSTDDLEQDGAKTGLVIEYAKGAQKPEKIKPNEVPRGVDALADMGSRKIKGISGVTDAMRGHGGTNQSGIAIQSQQYAAQMALALPLDNLAKTRHMVAERIKKIVQVYMTEPQIIRISETLPNGKKVTREEIANDIGDDGSLINDLTIGIYDTVITEQPTQVTFQNSQFEAADKLKERGVNIPDEFMVRYSPLADKTELMEAIRAQAESQSKLSELEEAKALLARAQATAKNIEALFSASRTSQSLQPLLRFSGGVCESAATG
jgi:hypothetical protein